MRTDLPTPGPRRQAARRRAQVRRRRALALAALVALAALSVWAAFAVSRPVSTRVPVAAAAPTVLASPAGEDLVPVAEADGVDLLLPVSREVSTAVAFRPSDVAEAVSLTPVGRRAAGGDLGERLGDVLAGGGEVAYALLDGAGEGSCDVLEVGAVPGSPVVSPVDGRVVSLQRYRLLGRYPDVELRIQCADDPSLLVVVSHLRRPQVAVGDPVAAGRTSLAELRGFPASLQQSLGRLTSDAGDHVQIMVLRVEAGLTGL